MLMKPADMAVVSCGGAPKDINFIQAHKALDYGVQAVRPGGAVILLDTHAWVWHVAEPEKLSERAAAAIEESDRIAVSAISCWEVATLVSKGRLAFDRPTRDWLLQALASVHPVVRTPQSMHGVITPSITLMTAAPAPR